jgi:radical SAM superfamily enzyme
MNVHFCTIQMRRTRLSYVAYFCLVTSFHDGINLVAEDYVATRNDDGVVALSIFTDPANILGDLRELRMEIPGASNPSHIRPASVSPIAVVHQ